MKCGKLGKSQFDADTYVWPSDEKSSHICVLDNKKPIQRSTIVHFSNHEGANTRLNFLFENFNQNWSSSISANLFSVSSVIHPKPSVFPPSRLPTLKKIIDSRPCFFWRKLFLYSKDRSYVSWPAAQKPKRGDEFAPFGGLPFYFLAWQAKNLLKNFLDEKVCMLSPWQRSFLVLFFLKLSRWIHYTPRIVKSYDPIIIS